MGALGTLGGTLLGLLLALILKRYQFIELPQDVYYVEKLPVQIQGGDVALVTLAALGIVLVATAYPGEFFEVHIEFTHAQIHIISFPFCKQDFGEEICVLHEFDVEKQSRFIDPEFAVRECALLVGMKKRQPRFTAQTNVVLKRRRS